jgi:hypothetical protein
LRESSVLQFNAAVFRGNQVSPEEAIRHALDGSAVLFTGAGFSWGATNQEKNQIPGGVVLAKSLLQEVGYDKTGISLDKASAAYLRRKDSRDLVDYLVPKFTTFSVSESHRLLASVPFRRVYTTNYDDVMEFARREIALPFAPIESVVPPKDALGRKGLILHINGSISNLTEEKLHKSFKLTSGSYATESFEASGWAFHFRQDLRAARAIIFIGYSMYDLDIRRIMFEENISDRCVFITGPLSDENELDAEDLADLGVLAAIGVDAFAQMVKRVAEVYEPQEPEVVTDSWRQLQTHETVDRLPSDQEVLDALMYGLLSERLLVEASGPNADHYTILRSELDAIVADVREGQPTVVVGDLGSGKSFILELVGRRIARDGVDVFYLVSSDRAVEEASLLAKDGRKLLLIVENYYRHMELLRWLGDTGLTDVFVLMTARPSAHDLFQTDLLKVFGSRTRFHDTSVLDSQEIRNAADLLDRYGLWGDRGGWPPHKKASYIREDCASSLASILVDIINSQHISERYKTLLQQCAGRADVERVLICVFVLEVMGFIPTIPKIQELLSNSVAWAGIRAESNLRPIINFESNQIRARSSVLALHLLHHVFELRRLVDVMIEIARMADGLRFSKEYSQILNELMRYKNVGAVLPERGRLDSTISFYEGVKNLGSTRKNPQFWLQYAIACLAIGRLDRAGRYFKHAYSLVYDGYDTSKIDNHYARYLVEVSLIEPSFKDAMGSIDKAAKIVLQQMADEVKYYPYRVALGLFKFYEKNRSELGPADKQSFIKIFSQIERRTASARGSLAKNRYVSECRIFSARSLAELVP